MELSSSFKRMPREAFGELETSHMPPPRGPSLGLKGGGQLEVGGRFTPGKEVNVAALTSSIQARDQVFRPGHQELLGRARPGTPLLSLSFCSPLACEDGQRPSVGFRLQEGKALALLLPLEERAAQRLCPAGRPRRTALGGAGARRLTWSTKVRSGSTMAVTCCGEGPDSAAPRVFPGPELATRVKLEKGKPKNPNQPL